MEQTRNRDFRYPAFAAALMIVGAVTGFGLGGVRTRPVSAASSATTISSSSATAAPASGGAAVLPRPSNDVFPAIAKAETSAVVNVTTSQTVQMTSFEGAPDQLFGRRF